VEEMIRGGRREEGGEEEGVEAGVGMIIEEEGGVAGDRHGDIDEYGNTSSCQCTKGPGCL
jgi:hypothetical protein